MPPPLLELLVLLVVEEELLVVLDVELVVEELLELVELVLLEAVVLLVVALPPLPPVAPDPPAPVLPFPPHATAKIDPTKRMPRKAECFMAQSYFSLGRDETTARICPASSNERGRKEDTSSFCLFRSSAAPLGYPAEGVNHAG